MTSAALASDVPECPGMSQHVAALRSSAYKQRCFKSFAKRVTRARGLAIEFGLRLTGF